MITWILASKPLIAMIAFIVVWCLGFKWLENRVDG